jgi:solute carrier family 14 (urea transporter)
MPYSQKWVLNQNVVIQIIDAVFRGVAQVVFMNNTISGIIITIGIFVSSRYYALCMLLSTFVSTIAALIFQLNKEALANGIYGYNGTLVGIGIAVFHFGDDTDFLKMPQIIGPIVLMSILSTIFVSGIGSLFVGKFGISPFTIPFILCVWIWILGASGSYSYFPINGQILH